MPHPLERILLAASLGLLAGCGGLEVHRHASAGAPLPTRVVAVYPFALRWGAPAYRGYELAQDELGAILDDGRLAALGPTEFKLLDPQSDAIFAGTDLAGSLAGWGLRPGNLLGLRGWAERREASDVEVLYDKAGKAVGQRRNADVTLVVHRSSSGRLPGRSSPRPGPRSPSIPLRTTRATTSSPSFVSGCES